MQDEALANPVDLLYNFAYEDVVGHISEQAIRFVNCMNANPNQWIKRLVPTILVYIGIVGAGMANTQDVRCAIVQFDHHYPDEVPLDAERLVVQIREAADHGAKIIVAPENCLHRYDPWSQNGATQLDLANWFDALITQFSELAAELNVCLVLGFREPSGRSQPTYQSAVFLGHDGTRLKTYRKRVPSISESEYTEAGGDDYASFETPYGQVWMQICKDMDDGGYAENMPTNIALFIGISKDASRGWSKVAAGCAKARCYGIGSNWGTGGNSGFVNPLGNVLSEAGTGEKIIYATMPLPVPGAPTDSDGDGMADFWEIAYFNDLDDNGLEGAGDDHDGDDLSNLEEYLAGTIPTNRASRLDMAIAFTNDSVVVTYSALRATGSGYETRTRFVTLQTRLDIHNGDWKNVDGHTEIVGNDTQKTFTNMPTGESTFYRVAIELR